MRFQLPAEYGEWRRERVWELNLKGKNKIIACHELKIVNNSIICYPRQINSG